MHKMIKRIIFFLIFAIVTGVLAWNNIVPTLTQTFQGSLTQTFQGLSLISIILVMFFGVSYSLRGDDFKPQ